MKEFLEFWDERRFLVVVLVVAATGLVFGMGVAEWHSRTANDDRWSRVREDANAFVRELLAEDAVTGRIVSTYCAREEHWRDGPAFHCRVSVDDGREQPRVAMVRCRPGNGCVYDEEAARAFRQCAGGR